MPPVKSDPGFFLKVFWVKMAEDFQLEIAELWEVVVEHLFNKIVYVNRLEELLAAHGIKHESMILDVSGGFGFPAAELALRGYQVVLNDGSREMFSRAMDYCEKLGAPEYVWATANMGPGQMLWQEFEDLSPDQWNALICKGNSLPYAVSWGKGNPDLSKARAEIKTVLPEADPHFYDKHEEGDSHE